MGTFGFEILCFQFSLNEFSLWIDSSQEMFSSLLGGPKWSSFPYFPPTTHSLMAFFCGADSAESFRGMEGLALEQAAVPPHSQQNPSFKAPVFTGIPSDTQKLLGIHPVFPSDQVKGAVLTRVWWWWGREWCELAWAWWWLLMAWYVLPIFICHVSCPQGLPDLLFQVSENLAQPAAFKGCVNLCSTSRFWLKEEMMVTAPWETRAVSVNPRLRISQSGEWSSQMAQRYPRCKVFVTDTWMKELFFSIVPWGNDESYLPKPVMPLWKCWSPTLCVWIFVQLSSASLT